MAGLLVTVLALGVPATASAEECRASGSHDWDSIAWSCMHRPTAADHAIIESGDSVTVSKTEEAGSLTLGPGAELIFSGGSTLAVKGATSATSGTLSGSGTLTSEGAFTKTGTDSGSGLTVNGGAQLRLLSDGQIDAGHICLGANGRLTLDAQLTITNDSRVNTTVFSCADGTLQINSIGTLVSQHTGASVATPVDNDGLVSVAAGTLTLSSQSPGHSQTGRYTTAATTTLSLASGTIALAAGATVDGTGTLHINSTGTLTSQHTTPNVHTPTTVAGTVTVPAGGQLTFGSPLSVSGGAARVAGTLAGAVTLTNGGTLSGDGTVTGDVVNTSGTVRPGSSPGSLAVGEDFEQGPDGTLAIDLQGTEPGTGFDVLQVAGTATLGGTVAVTHAAGFDPPTGSSFAFLTAGSRSGAFAQTTGDPPPNGRVYLLQHTDAPAGARLVVSAPETSSPSPDPAASPAPATSPAPAPAPATAPTTAPSTAPEPSPLERQLARSSRGRVATALGLPSSRRCLPRTRRSLGIRRISGVTYKSVRVLLGSKRLRVRRTKGQHRVTLDLRRLRARRPTVTVRIVTSFGTRLVGSRRYRTCSRRTSR